MFCLRELTMKKLFFAVFATLSTMQLITPMHKEEDQIARQKSFLQKILTAAWKDKYLSVQNDWKNYYLKRKISKKEHDKMVEYLNSKSNAKDTVAAIFSSPEEQEWLKELEEKNSMGFTAFLYYEACSSERDQKGNEDEDHFFIHSSELYNECMNCILF